MRNGKRSKHYDYGIPLHNCLDTHVSYLREVYDIDKVLSRQSSIRNLNFGKKVNEVLISRSPADF